MDPRNSRENLKALSINFPIDSEMIEVGDLVLSLIFFMEFTKNSASFLAKKDHQILESNIIMTRALLFRVLEKKEKDNPEFKEKNKAYFNLLRGFIVNEVDRALNQMVKAYKAPFKADITDSPTKESLDKLVSLSGELNKKVKKGMAGDPPVVVPKESHNSNPKLEPINATLKSTPLIFSYEQIPFNQRWQGVQIICYKYHIAIKVDPIQNEENPAQSYKGIYVSYGPGGSEEYDNEMEADISRYGQPVTFSLDLPKGITYAELNSIKMNPRERFSLLVNNCSDEAFAFLNDQLGYDLGPVDLQLITTPEYIGRVANSLAINQNNEARDYLINQQKLILETPSNFQNSVICYYDLVKSERVRLEAERASVKLAAAGYAWNSFNFLNKLHNNIMQGPRIKLIDAKDAYLAALQEKLKPNGEFLTDPKVLKNIHHSFSKKFGKNNPFKFLLVNFPTHLLSRSKVQSEPADNYSKIRVKSQKLSSSHRENSSIPREKITRVPRR